MMELRFVRFICAGETFSRDPGEGSQRLQKIATSRFIHCLKSMAAEDDFLKWDLYKACKKFLIKTKMVKLCQDLNLLKLF